MYGGEVLAVAGAGYSSEITFTVVMSCLMAASGGLIFGYDIGITGASSSLNTHIMHACVPIQSGYTHAELELETSRFVLRFLSPRYIDDLCAVFSCVKIRFQNQLPSARVHTNSHRLQEFDPIPY
jgi:hypothetical protein